MTPLFPLEIDRGRQGPLLVWQIRSIRATVVRLPTNRGCDMENVEQEPHAAGPPPLGFLWNRWKWQDDPFLPR